MVTRAAAAHLLRRATFGPRAEEVDAAQSAGLDATLATLLHPTAADAGSARTPVPDLGPDPYLALGRNADQEARQKARQQQVEQVRQATRWWVDRMTAADAQLSEKLIFFWHGHWATSAEKVGAASLMLRQQDTFRRYGAGDFGLFLKAMLRDPALIIWLDGHKNTRRAPNENLARELMELFTLGIGHYTEDDVKAGAKALTGWLIDKSGQNAVFTPGRHDDGIQTLLGHTGQFDADGFADLLLGNPAHADFLARRLWFRFASSTRDLPEPTRARMADAYRPARDTTAMLQALFTDPEFARSAGQLVKQPVEWAVGAARQLDVRPGALAVADQRRLMDGLDDLGQLPFRPPSVGGWPAGAAWLTTSATQVRLRLADTLAAHVAPAVAAKLTSVPEKQRVDALARLLVVDTFTDRSRAVLAPAVRNVRRLLTLGLASPEYTVH